MMGDSVAVVTGLIPPLAKPVLSVAHHVPLVAGLVPGFPRLTSCLAHRVPLVTSQVALLTDLIPFVTRPIPLVTGQITHIGSGRLAPPPTLGCLLASGQPQPLDRRTPSLRGAIVRHQTARAVGQVTTKIPRVVDKLAA